MPYEKTQPMKSMWTYHQSIALTSCLMLFGLIFPLSAQNDDQANFCGSDRMLLGPKSILKSEIWQRFEESYISIMSSGHYTSRRSSVTLPVVFHVIHENGPENISNALVLAGLDHLNQAFANVGYFDSGSGVNTQIQFCLARRDPDGQVTDGIIRQRSSLTQHDVSNDLSLKGLEHWGSESYINIYLVSRICDGSNCNIIGYSSFPSSHGMPDDGIVMEASYVGVEVAQTTVLVHEMGHYLGLYHTFTQGCLNNNCLSEGDRVCDTPPDQMVGGPLCFLPVNSCSSDEDDSSTNNPFRSMVLGGMGDQPDMVENYMDYSELNCYSAFSQGQADRMCFSVETIRRSLLNSFACVDPCPMPITVDILQNDLTLPLGSNQTFESIVDNATNITWTINGVFESNSTSFNYSFNQEGEFEIILVGENDDVLCQQVSDTIMVEIICPTEAEFLPKIRGCIPIDTTISFNNISTPTATFQWFVDDIFYSSDQHINYTFNSAGNVNIMLVAATTICQDTVQHIFSVDCSESCTNGYDDDGNMLVDQFDPKCCDPASLYSFLCDSSCYQEVPLNVDLNVEWVSSTQTSYVYSPAVGDLDADGQTEVVSIVRENFIARIDGSTGNEISRFSGRSDLTGGLSLGDLDGDGLGEILAITRQGFIECYDHDGTFKFISDTKIPLVFPTLGSSYAGLYACIADFNQDGNPEFYVGNQIFNGQTGKLISTGGNQARGAGQKSTPVNDVQKLATVAIDILPDDFCATCSGLELAAGHQIYTVDIDNDEMNIVVENTELRDAFTSIVDYDRDGDLDIVGIATFFDLPDPMNLGPGMVVYAWDGQTTETIGKYELYDWSIVEVSEQVVGNFDDDDDLEIAFHAYRGLMMFDNDFSIKWQISTIDGSATPAMGFDFDQDGILEIVYRDDRVLGIYDGPSGSLVSSVPMASGTAAEHFVMADVDNDQSIEIVSYGDITPPFIGGYHCVGSDGFPAWPNSNSTFNQSMFFNVNINNDLSVPPQQQNHHLVGDKKILNNFRVPLSIPVPSIDASVDSIQIFCDGGPKLRFEICNESSSPIRADMPVTIYCGDPSSAASSAILTMTLGELLLENECLSFTADLTISCTDNIYVVVNDDQSVPPPFDPSNFPLTTVYECEYGNNIGFILVAENNILNIGEDQVLCPGTTSIELNASNKFESYLWDDGSIDSIRIVDGPGSYWVEVSDICGRIFRDTIEILMYVNPPMLDLGNDTSFCAFGIFIVDAGAGYASYRWSDGSRDQTYTAWDPGTYSVTVEDVCGNIQMDDISLSILEPEIIDLGSDTTICEGDSILLSLPGYMAHQWGLSDGFSCSDCPSTFAYPIEKTTYYLLAQNVAGCFVYDSITVSVDTPHLTELFFELCPSDSIQIGEQWITTSGDFILAFESNGACDSMVVAHVAFHNTASFEATQDTTIRLGDQLILQARIDGLAPAETYWFPPEEVNCSTCPSISTYPSENIIYIVEAYDENNCMFYDSIEIEVLIPGKFYVPTAFSPNNDGINDLFYVHSSIENNATYSIKIFNRWGGKVFERKDVSVNDQFSGWDGWYKNKPMDSALFVYEIELNDSVFITHFTGEIFLVR